MELLVAFSALSPAEQTQCAEAGGKELNGSGDFKV